MSERHTWPAGHVIHMTLVPMRRGSPGRLHRTCSLAKCDCGWEHRATWELPALRRQDIAVEKHWRHVEQLAPPAPPL